MIAKKTLSIILLSFLLSCTTNNKKKLSENQEESRKPASSNEFCNWGFAGPKYFKYRGKTYVYGSVACASGIYSDIFCEERYSKSGQNCVADNSPDTIACHQQMQRLYNNRF